jgi:hypothetical protein
MTTAASPAALIETHFGELKDPRAAHSIEHKLIDILMIIICATICGANDWEAIAEYGQSCSGYSAENLAVILNPIIKVHI